MVPCRNGWTLGLLMLLMTTSTTIVRAADSSSPSTSSSTQSSAPSSTPAQPAQPAVSAQPSTTPAAKSAAAIQENMEVQLEYTLSADGQVVDSTDGQAPFKYIHGRGQIIPGLEKQLAGLKTGDSKEITVTPEEGYGPVDPTAIVDVPKNQLPTGTVPEVGMVLRGVDPDGRAFRATIQEIKDQTVKLNLNHPLAGKTLHFKVKILEITPAAPQ